MNSVPSVIDQLVPQEKPSELFLQLSGKNKVKTPIMSPDSIDGSTSISTPTAPGPPPPGTSVLTALVGKIQKREVPDTLDLTKNKEPKPEESVTNLPIHERTPEEDKRDIKTSTVKQNSPVVPVQTVLEHVMPQPTSSSLSMCN